MIILKKLILFITLLFVLISCKENTSDFISIENNKITFNSSNITEVKLIGEEDLIIEDEVLNKALEDAINGKEITFNEIRCNCAVTYSIYIDGFRFEFNRHSVSILEYDDPYKSVTYHGSIELEYEVIENIYRIIQNNIVELI